MFTDMDALIQRHERILITGLCIIAAIRILLFSAAFPFFNNVDEQLHFDMVHKYARGYLPRKGNDRYDRDSALLIVMYGTPEYLRKSGDFPDGRIPDPPWQDPQRRTAYWLMEQAARWQTLMNHEAFSPPVYYMLAGLWYDLGKLFGMEGGDLLYWVRFMNIPVYIALVCLCHRFGRKFFPKKPQLWFGASLLITFFPQDVFYSINSDVLSPLFVGASLYLLLSIYFEEKGLFFYALTGIVISAALLVKLSNVMVMPLACIFFFLRIFRSNQTVQTGGMISKWLLLLLAAGAPVAVWLGWNHFVLGDFFGTTAKIQALGWTVKPIREWWCHPFFTLTGLEAFTATLAKSFWRGEFVWGFQPIASSWMDVFYAASTFFLILLSIAGLFFAKDANQSRERFVAVVCAGIILMYVTFLVWVSVRFDYGDSWYPSREHPYFSSGRLMLGALIPFAFLYVRGIDLLVSRFCDYVQPAVVVSLIAVIITCNEVAISGRIFGSLYNWFHL